VWSASLCKRYFLRDLRHRPDDPVEQGPPENVYDRRFLSLFLDQLSLRDQPRYPDQNWHRALVGADSAWAELGDRRSLKPLLRASQVEGSARTPESRGDGDLGRVVGLACDQWLAGRGLFAQTLY
jgi:hypothetical protein